MQGSLEQQSATFLAPGTGLTEDSFSTDRGGDGFRMIQAHHIYHALYFCYFYISSTSDHQASDPRPNAAGDTPALEHPPYTHGNAILLQQT